MKLPRAAAVAVAAVLLATGCTDASEPSDASAPPTRSTAARPSDPTGVHDCRRAAVARAVRGFLDAWNARDGQRLKGLLADAVLLDMSTKDQAVEPRPVNGSYESRQGRSAVLAFIRRQWSLGERFEHGRVQPFEGGAGVSGLVAHFDDGSTQPIAEAKLAFDCGSGSFTHMVITAGRVARR